MVDTKGRVYLLEVNSNPDFKATDNTKFRIYQKPIEIVFGFLKRKLTCIQKQFGLSTARPVIREFSKINKHFEDISCACNRAEFVG